MGVCGVLAGKMTDGVKSIALRHIVGRQTSTNSCRHEEKTSIADLFCNWPRAADGGGEAEKLRSRQGLPLGQHLMNQHAPLSDRHYRNRLASYSVFFFPP